MASFPLAADRPGRVLPRRHQAARGHSVLVRVLRVTLPLAAFGLLAALIIMPMLAEDPVLVSDQPLQNEMHNARFSSRDDKLRPVGVTAALARQEDRNQTRFTLQDAEARLGLEDGAEMALAAMRGAFDRLRNHLDLSDGVTLSHSNGLTLTVADASIDTKARLAWSFSPTRGQGPAGTLEAQGFRIEEAGKRVIFTGPARLVIRPEALADLNPPDQAKQE